MTVTDELLKNNEAYARSFDKGNLPLPPAKKLAVLACMDARLHVNKILGLKEGDAHIIRNAGGVATDDAIRSLTISQRLLGTDEIILIHHTDCGMLTFSDDQVKASIANEVGIRPHFALEAFPSPLCARSLFGPAGRRPSDDRQDQGEPFHPQKGQDPRVRLRREDRSPQRGGGARSGRGDPSGLTPLVVRQKRCRIGMRGAIT